MNINNNKPKEIDYANIPGPVNSYAGYKIAGVQVTANATEINQRVDDSLMVETIKAAGPISTTTSETSLSLPGAGAVTLAAPTKPCFDKIITMTVDNGDVTLSLANCVDGTAATTCTFNDVNDYIILKANLARGKWSVIKQAGVVLT